MSKGFKYRVSGSRSSLAPSERKEVIRLGGRAIQRIADGEIVDRYVMERAPGITTGESVIVGSWGTEYPSRLYRVVDLRVGGKKDIGRARWKGYGWARILGKKPNPPYQDQYLIQAYRGHMTFGKRWVGQSELQNIELF